MNNAQKGDKILEYDNEQTTVINSNKNKNETLEQSITALDTKFSKDYIVDYGSNANGNWEKWSSGKLVQWGEVTFTFDIARTWGSLYYGSTQTIFNFPMTFKSIEVFDHNLTSGSGISFIPAQYVVTNYNESNFFGFSGVRPNVGNGAIGVVNYIAIGRWK